MDLSGGRRFLLFAIIYSRVGVSAAAYRVRKSRRFSLLPADCELSGSSPHVEEPQFDPAIASEECTLPCAFGQTVDVDIALRSKRSRRFRQAGGQLGRVDLATAGTPPGFSGPQPR